jgi:NAD(P)-dependent dehydrogenase (short-subunit alcohol dehydrogenase family)
MTTRVAVVTGAAQGLGLEVSRGLAASGHRVILTGRDGAALERAAATLPKGRDHRIALLDIASDASVAAFFKELATHEDRLDVLVNNAGRLYGRADDLDSPADVIAEAIGNNALGAWRMMQRAIPMMNAQGWGRIANVSSGMGALESLGPDAVPYRASKATLDALTLIAAPACGPGVKLNAVCPGWVRTEMGGSAATRTLEEGASGILWAATLPDDGPHGGFFRDGRRIAW